MIQRQVTRDSKQGDSKHRMSTGFPDPVIRDFAICHGDEVPSRGIDDRVKSKIGNDDQSYDCEKLLSVHGDLCAYLMCS